MKYCIIFLVVSIIIAIGLLILLGFLLYSWGNTLFWNIMIPILVVVISSAISIIIQFIESWMLKLINKE